MNKADTARGETLAGLEKQTDSDICLSSPFNKYGMSLRERVTDKQTDRQIQRDKERESNTHRVTDRETEKNLSRCSREPSIDTLTWLENFMNCKH